MRKSDLYRDYDLVNVSKTLHKNMTRHEKHLWYDFLAKHPLR